jgi:hypothetical protein
MTVRCKFRVNDKNPSGNVSLSPVYTDSEENKAFFKATPGGSISFWTTNVAAADEFNVGDEFYVDFTKAEKPAS